MSALLEVSGLRVSFRLGSGRLQALRGVDLRLEQGEVLGLVGESGCGKSTLARCVVGLVRPDAGRVLLGGRPLARLPRKGEAAPGRQVQLIFQDPEGSLDPRMTVERIIGEPLAVHGLCRGASARSREAGRLLEQVGLSPELLGRRPHQLSGGQRQRVAIARALATRPRLLMADEPVSALDLPLRGQILDLLARLHRRHGLSYLLISHDLAPLRRLASRVAVMYLGRVVEQGPTAALLDRPLHPYSAALVDASTRSELPAPGQGERRPGSRRLLGEVPSPLSPPPGCPFHPRCATFRRRNNPRCQGQEPALLRASGDHLVACHEVDSALAQVGHGAHGVEADTPDTG